MSATYDPTLSTNQSWVRFLIGDTNVTGMNARLSDEEIVGLLDEEIADTGSGAWTKYLAAARALDAMLAKWSAAGGGKLSEQVSKLSITRAVGQSGEQAVRDRACVLRERGAELLLEKPRMMLNL